MVGGLPDFEKLRFEFPFPKAWKLLVSWCQRKLVERRRQSEPAQPAPVPGLQTFSCDECEAVCNKLQALRSHHTRAHQRRREVPDSICSVCKADFRSRPKGHSASGGGSEAVRLGIAERSSRFRMTRWQLPTSKTARTSDSVSGRDEVMVRGRQC